MRKILIAILVAAAAVLVPVAVASAGTKIGTTGGGHGGQSYVPGQVIVKFRPTAAATARTAALRVHGARVARSITTRGAVLVDLPDGANVPKSASAIRRDPSVAWAQPNYYQQGGGMPNDALFSQQWALHNTGQVVHGIAGTAGADIHAPEAWDRTTGSAAVKVAVVDSGITFGQPDLAPNIWHNPGETGNGRESNGVDDDGDGFVDDSQGWDFVQQDNNPTDNYGHGTEIASILGARGGNGIGVSGVAQQVSIIPVRVLDNFNMTSCAEGAQGLAYAVKAGAQVVNFSVGTSNPCQPQRDVIDSAPNVLFVVSAMNEGANVDQSPQYPCSYPEANIVCVGATDSKDQLWQESNYGAQSVDLAAPGVNVLGAAPIAGARETIYEDGFENPLFGHWLPDNLNGGWDRTQALAHSGSWSLTDSPNGNYANNTNSSVYLMEQLNLVGKSDCYAKVWVKRNFSPFPASWPGGDDAILAESSPDYRTWGRRLDGRLGSSDWEEWDIDLSELEGRSSLGAFRFRLQTDEVGAFDGVYLDDFTVRCLPMVSAYSGAPGEFDVVDGTSYAAPQVTGAAALLLSLNPRLSAVDLKQRLLSSVDPLPALAGKTVTGGRLNVAKAVATIPLPKSAPRKPNGLASALSANLRALAKRLRIGPLLARSGFRIRMPVAGRLSVALRGADGRTLAGGNCSATRPGRCSLRVKLTRHGRSLLRHRRQLHVNLVLRYKPSTGHAQVQRTSLTLR